MFAVRRRLPADHRPGADAWATIAAVTGVAGGWLPRCATCASPPSTTFAITEACRPRHVVAAPLYARQRGEKS
jgi:hypothetical protein